MTAPFHTHAAIIATGDELAIGQSLNSNSMWIADRLLRIGVRTVEHITVGDDLAATAGAIRRLAETVPLIITTGGLGPTADDVTRAALADALGEPLITDESALAAIEARLRARGRAISENQRLQALRPPSAICLPNTNGTAPGLHAFVRSTGSSGGADVFCLPGPPRELWPMFEHELLPRLRPDPARLVRTRLLQAVGIAEADAAARLGDLMRRDRSPLVGVTVSGAVLTVRIRLETAASDAAAVAHAEAQLDETERLARERLNPHIYASGDDTLESAVVARLRAAGRTLVTAESCTGGGLGAMLTRVPGASDVYLGGWITYANAMKQQEVAVPADLLAAHGAVSEPVARAMARGALADSAATDALAITGVAGPGGGTESKPVGTVYIAHAARSGSCETRRFHFTGDREDIRDRSSRSALAMLLFTLPPSTPPAPTLLWQTPPH